MGVKRNALLLGKRGLLYVISSFCNRLDEEERASCFAFIVSSDVLFL